MPSNQEYSQNSAKNFQPFYRVQWISVQNADSFQVNLSSKLSSMLHFRDKSNFSNISCHFRHQKHQIWDKICHNWASPNPSRPPSIDRAASPSLPSFPLSDRNISTHTQRNLYNSSQQFKFRNATSDVNKNNDQLSQIHNSTFFISDCHQTKRTSTQLN